MNQQIKISDLKSGYYWVKEYRGKPYICEFVINEEDGIWEYWVIGSDFCNNRKEFEFIGLEILERVNEPTTDNQE